MRAPPPLDHDAIASCLQSTYGVSAADIAFLPLGYDARAAVYRVSAADGQLYFLKARHDAVDPLSVRVPRYLNEQGIAQAVAPLPTLTGDLWGHAAAFTLLLYPYIEGQVGWAIPFTDDQWRQYGAIVRRIHDTRLSSELHDALPAAAFVPPAPQRSIIERALAEVGTRTYTHPAAQRLAAFWHEHRAEIESIVRRADALGRTLQAQPPPLVLCHNDIHPGNLIATPSDGLFVVDWDQPLLAPRERDLMLVINEPGIDRFWQGYGPIDLDQHALAYAFYERLVQDLGEFAELVFFMDVCAATKEEWATTCQSLFAPHGWVEAAHRLYEGLPPPTP